MQIATSAAISYYLSDLICLQDPQNASVWRRFIYFKEFLLNINERYLK